MRILLAVLAAAGSSALGGAILGEYTLANLVAIVACVLFGVVVGEATAVPRRPPRPAGLAAAALFPSVAWVWSLWISTGHQLGYASVAQWVATPFAGAAAVAWAATAARGGPTGPRDEGEIPPPEAGGATGL
ncbi:MAG TPA: hypothetical protein VFW24_01550 [Acidimicrobiales bacterium]|nr:hypothetical protein [Acidimicrobiales bacterium]